jgi:hypothetical protein
VIKVDEQLTTPEAQLEKIISNLIAINESINPNNGGDE